MNWLFYIYICGASLLSAVVTAFVCRKLSWNVQDEMHADSEAKFVKMHREHHLEKSQIYENSAISYWSVVQEYRELEDKFEAKEAEFEERVRARMQENHEENIKRREENEKLGNEAAVRRLSNFIEHYYKEEGDLVMQILGINNTELLKIKVETVFVFTQDVLGRFDDMLKNYEFDVKKKKKS